MLNALVQKAAIAHRHSHRIMDVVEQNALQIGRLQQRGDVDIQAAGQCGKRCIVGAENGARIVWAAEVICNGCSLVLMQQ